MEEWRIHRLFETDDVGVEREIGGAITRMDIGSVNGPLHEISVQPVDIEQMKEELWDDQFVRLQVADRVIWMKPLEVENLIDFMKIAYEASIKNYDRLQRKNSL